MKGPCLCGDTECPWCGGAQGTCSGPDPSEPSTNCEVCGDPECPWCGGAPDPSEPSTNCEVCGDPECPWCGGAQGTCSGPDPSEPSTNCEICGEYLEGQEFATGLCAKCLEEVKKAIRTVG